MLARPLIHGRTMANQRMKGEWMSVCDMLCVMVPYYCWLASWTRFDIPSMTISVAQLTISILHTPSITGERKTEDPAGSVFASVHTSFPALPIWILIMSTLFFSDNSICPTVKIGTGVFPFHVVLTDDESNDMKPISHFTEDSVYTTRISGWYICSSYVAVRAQLISSPIQKRKKIGREELDKYHCRNNLDSQSKCH